jgi:crotonobetainyl-CoA:carnitine CoA-transferase CaiB-like acyl-CoA transferase
MFVEKFFTGSGGQTGIGYEEIPKENPRIIYGSISGFGQTGPYKSKPAYDVVTQAMGGFMALTGEKDGKPYKLGPSIVDASAGIHMAFAIMSAVYCRERTGQGQFIDVAMMDTAFSTLENFIVTKTLTGTAPTRNGNANLGSAPFNSFKSKDGYVTIACANDSLFSKLVHVMGRTDLLDEPKYKSNSLRKINEADLNKTVEEWTSRFTTQEICKMLDEAKVPVGPILGVEELIRDPHLKSREMLVEIPHPVLGTIVYPGNPLKFSDTSEICLNPAPLLGQHTDEILENILGKSKEEIAELRNAKVI